MMFLTVFIAALLGTTVGIFAGAISAYRVNQKWMNDNK